MKGWNFQNNQKKKQPKEVIAKQKNKIFGINPLRLSATLLSDQYKSCIPNILIRLKHEIFAKNDHLCEGIFRLAPCANQCKQIENELNANGLSSEQIFDNVNGALLANLIKIWFRKLPIPILQNVDIAKIEKIQATQSMEDAKSVLDEVKEPYISYLQWLLDLCLDISKYEKDNKMSAKNMAVVVSPNLFDPTKCKNPMQAMTVSMAMVKFVELAIEWRKQQLLNGQ